MGDPHPDARGGRGGGARVLAILAISIMAVTGSVAVAVGAGEGRNGAASQVPLSRLGEQCPRDSPSASCVWTAAAVVAPGSLPLPRSIPVGLIIPAISVDTPVQRLGLNPDGSLAVPAPGPHYDEAAWYRYSPTPGSLGPAIIVGHLDSATDPRSVFYRLGSLQPRDRILIRRTDGLVAVFSVSSVRRYRKSQFPTDLVYRNTAYPALRLITCGGPVDPSTGHYRDNVIVWAALVGTTSVARPVPPQSRDGRGVSRNAF